MASISSLWVLAKSDPNVFAESLKGYGLKVIGRKSDDPLETRIAEESVQSIASIMTEDRNTMVEMSPATAQAKALAEQHGYIVELIR